MEYLIAIIFWNIEILSRLKLYNTENYFMHLSVHFRVTILFQNQYKSIANYLYYTFSYLICVNK